MGSIDRRLRLLEEREANDGWDAAIHALSEEDRERLLPYAERAVAADEACLPRPEPNPEEAEVLGRLAALRRRAVREGWPPPPWPWGPARRPGDRSWG